MSDRSRIHLPGKPGNSGPAGPEGGLAAKLCYARVIHPLSPRDVNPLGSVFGGYVMDLVDRVANLAAGTFASLPTITASLDLISFAAGIRGYQRVVLTAYGTRTFRTSMEVRIQVEGEDPDTGRRWHTSDATLTLVALNRDGKPTPFPRLVPESENEQQAWRDAGRRRKLRLAAPAEPAPDYYAADHAGSRHLSFEMNTDMVMPRDVNELGFITAGNILSTADRLAGIVASRHARTPSVTAIVDRVSFSRPIRLGEVSIVKAYVTRSFRTSMEVRAEIWKRRAVEDEPVHVSTAYFTYVALGEDGRPAPVPAVKPVNEREQGLYDSATERRRLRMETLGLISGGRGRENSHC
ncbi:MAG: hotdog domain-containing protein [Thermaerobacterales bacterium]